VGGGWGGDTMLGGRGDVGGRGEGAADILEGWCCPLLLVNIEG